MFLLLDLFLIQTGFLEENCKLSTRLAQHLMNFSEMRVKTFSTKEYRFAGNRTFFVFLRVTEKLVNKQSVSIEIGSDIKNEVEKCRKRHF